MSADATRKSAPSTDEVVDAIVAAHATIESIFFDALQSVLPHVASAEFEVMEVLFTHGVQRASAISEALSLAPSTLTRYCDQLAALGLITRERAPQDRRETLIDLTRKGRNAVKTILSAQAGAFSARLGSLKAADRRVLVQALRRFDHEPALRRAASPIWARSHWISGRAGTGPAPPPDDGRLGRGSRPCDRPGGCPPLRQRMNTLATTRGRFGGSRACVERPAERTLVRFVWDGGDLEQRVWKTFSWEDPAARGRNRLNGGVRDEVGPTRRTCCVPSRCRAPATHGLRRAI